MATCADFLQALHSKCGFEPVGKEETPSRLRLAGRVVDGQTNSNTKNWLIVLQRLLRSSRGAGWSVDVSKHYLVPTERMVYEWRLIFQGEVLSNHYPAILQVIRSAPVSSRGEVTEIPLAGVNANRNNPAGGRRGAGNYGTVPVGPLALHARLMGG